MNVQFFRGALKRGVFEKCTEQFVMTRPAFVSARENRIDNAQVSRWTNPSLRESFAAAQMPVLSCGIFECAHHGGSHCDYTPTVLSREFDGSRRCFRNSIRFVKRQEAIEIVVAG